MVGIDRYPSCGLRVRDDHSKDNDILDSLDWPADVRMRTAPDSSNKVLPVQERFRQDGEAMTAQPRREASPATLGDVLYENQPATVVVEAEWVALVRAIADGDQLALHALYERCHRPVFTSIMRITRNREAADELTVDVFHDVWRHASRYDAKNGTVLGWMMNQARSRAIDRLRHDQRKKRVDPHPRDPAGEPDCAASSDDIISSEQARTAVRSALAVLTSDERDAIEAAFFGELTHAEVAERLQQPLGTVKTRIRSGLQKLRQALGRKASEP